MPGILHFLTIAFLFHYHIDLYILPLYYLLRVLYKFYSLHSKVFVILDFQIYLFFYIFRCIFMSATKLRFSYSVKATPTVLFPKLPLFFLRKQKKVLQQFSISGCYLFQIGKNYSACAFMGATIRGASLRTRRGGRV
jgi:hypothetical protein